MFEFEHGLAGGTARLFVRAAEGFAVVRLSA
jgi:hypothetical protein